MDDGASRSLAILQQRAARLPSSLRADTQRPLPPRPEPLRRTRRWVATGAGGSEGPARCFVAALQERGLAARFAALSSFALHTDTLDDDTALVVFSQGLSPNARLALRERIPTAIVTGVDPDADDPAAEALREALTRGAVAIFHGPADERELLVRIEGPARATLAGIRLAAAIAGESDEVPSLDLARPEPTDALEEGPIALVTAGGYGHYAHGLRWKLLEGVGVPDPPTWDVLQVAHGPLQQFYHGPMVLLCLERSPAERSLFDRLEHVVVPPRHRVRRLRATLPHPWSWFEHDAQLNAIALATLAVRPRDLIDWPGKGADHDLYDLAPG